MDVVKYSPDMGMEDTDFRSCRRCGINMQVASWSGRFLCDDCVEYEVQFQPGSYAWLFEEKES